MATVALTELYNDTVLELPKCLKPLIWKMIHDVLVEFCTKTQIWSLELDAIRLRDGEDTYDLDAPACANIDTIKGVTNDGSTLYPVTHFTFPSKNEIKLTWEPSDDTDDDADGMVVTVVLKPKRTATVIDKDLFESWYDAWAAGVKARLMLQPGKKWSNPELGLYYDRKISPGHRRGDHRAEPRRIEYSSRGVG